MAACDLSSFSFLCRSSCDGRRGDQRLSAEISRRRAAAAQRRETAPHQRVLEPLEGIVVELLLQLADLLALLVDLRLAKRPEFCRQ